LQIALVVVESLIRTLTVAQATRAAFNVFGEA
jgi:hypothetical protein